MHDVDKYPLHLQNRYMMAVLRSIKNKGYRIQQKSEEATYFNLFASGFKWLQSTFVYNILFAGDVNFSTRFTTNVNITGTKEA